jgi:hypothetical protein
MIENVSYKTKSKVISQISWGVCLNHHHISTQGSNQQSGRCTAGWAIFGAFSTKMESQFMQKVQNVLQPNTVNCCYKNSPYQEIYPLGYQKMPRAGTIRLNRRQFSELAPSCRQKADSDAASVSTVNIVYLRQL